MAGSLIVLLGPPGAGKSVQSTALAQKHGWLRVSSGELLRAQPDQELQAEIAAGNLAPTIKAQAVVQQALESAPREDTIMLDGFPRMISEARWLADYLAGANRQLEVVAYIKLDEHTSKSRLLRRGRSDDEEAAVETKWQEFKTQTLPVIEMYRLAGQLKEIDGGRSVEEVGYQLEQVIEAHT